MSLFYEDKRKAAGELSKLEDLWPYVILLIKQELRSAVEKDGTKVSYKGKGGLKFQVLWTAWNCVPNCVYTFLYKFCQFSKESLICSSSELETWPLKLAALKFWLVWEGAWLNIAKCSWWVFCSFGDIWWSNNILLDEFGIVDLIGRFCKRLERLVSQNYEKQ